MSQCIMCATTPGAGVRHRFAMLSAVKCFADHHGCSVCMLWGVTNGVAFCRFEELFAPVPGVRVVNLSPEQLSEVAHCAKMSRNIRAGGRVFRVFRPGDTPNGSLFSWDLIPSKALARLTAHTWRQVGALPAARIRAHTKVYARAHGIEARLGVRVRVEEILSRTRRPRRIMRELNETVKSIVRIPWYTRVFLATDSEYIQQMLASHFKDSIFLPKNFDTQEPTGRYVQRQDKDAMVTFLKEVDCLCHCGRIINIGGFLNDNSVKYKTMHPPYSEAAYMHMARR